MFSRKSSRSCRGAYVGRAASLTKEAAPHEIHSRRVSNAFLAYAALVLNQAEKSLNVGGSVEKQNRKALGQYSLCCHARVDAALVKCKHCAQVCPCCFHCLMIWSFEAQDFQSSVSLQNTAHMLRDLTRSMRDASPVDRNPRPEKHRIRNVQVARAVTWRYSTECTKPSHSQPLANFVANIHSQGISAARTIFAISFAKPFAFASEFLRNA